MRLKVFGRANRSILREFISHAKSRGFNVTAHTTLTQIVHNKDILYKGSDAVVCTIEKRYSNSELQSFFQAVEYSGTSRIVLLSDGIINQTEQGSDANTVASILSRTKLDWTIVISPKKTESMKKSTDINLGVSAKKLTHFLLNQVTDPCFLNQIVLVAR